MNQPKKKIIPAYSGFQLEGPKPRINEFKFALQKQTAHFLINNSKSYLSITL